MKRCYKSMSGGRVVSIGWVDELNGSMAFLTNLWTHPDHRQQGHATRVIEAIKRDADREGFILYLHASSSCGDSQNGLVQSDLENWYIRHGFHFTNCKTTGDFAEMNRHPN